MNQQKKSLLSVHISVLGLGLSCLIEKQDGQPAIVIAWGIVVLYK